MSNPLLGNEFRLFKDLVLILFNRLPETLVQGHRLPDDPCPCFSSRGLLFLVGNGPTVKTNPICKATQFVTSYDCILVQMKYPN